MRFWFFQKSGGSRGTAALAGFGGRGEAPPYQCKRSVKAFKTSFQHAPEFKNAESFGIFFPSNEWEDWKS